MNGGRHRSKPPGSGGRCAGVGVWFSFFPLSGPRSAAVDRKVVIRANDGAIAQLGERWLCKPEVAGSIPAGSTDVKA